MPRPPATEPTEVELQILKILWAEGPSTARSIHNQLQEHKSTNYSTTVKMLSVMLEKGMLLRDEEERPKRFRPASSQRVTQKRIVSRMIQKVFDGSAKSLIMQALSSKRATTEDLRAIREWIDELEQSESKEDTT